MTHCLDPATNRIREAELERWAHLELIIDYLREHKCGFTEAYYVTLADMALRIYGARDKR
tara:strand:- start:987 stop:1166 length:180 start_codon:yes stop_codon:yes gene_type:complete